MSTMHKSTYRSIQQQRVMFANATSSLDNTTRHTRTNSWLVDSTTSADPIGQECNIRAIMATRATDDRLMSK